MTADLGFVNLLAVAVVAVVAPIVAVFLPIRIPSVVLEIIAGIVIGPSVLGWVEADAPVAVLALVGLAFLLFLSGLEINLSRLRGEALRLPLLGFGLTLVLGVLMGVGAGAIGWVRNPFFLAVTLGATSLGIVAPVLKDSGQVGRPVGQLTLASATIADFATILMLSLVFAESEGGPAGRLSAIGMFVAVVVLISLGLARAGRSMRLDVLLVRLQDTTAAIRVRVSVAILLGFVALAAGAGLEIILGAFVAGAVLAFVDRDSESHPNFHLKLESIGFGFLVPIFFVASGLRFDLQSLTDDPAALLRVPAFLVALLVVRGLPAFLYRPAVGGDEAIAAGLLQSTSLPFIVTATQIGVAIDAVAPATAAALVAAGLLSTILYPPIALTLLSRNAPAAAPPAPMHRQHEPMGSHL